MSVWAPPSISQGYWTAETYIGIPGGIAQYAAGGVNDRAVTGTLVNMTSAPYSVDNTGSVSVDSALATAIAAASGPTVLYFPAGTYLFDTGFLFSSYKANITIRGAGIGVTTFFFSTTNQVFIFSAPGALDQDYQTVTGTKTKGTSVLSVSSSSAYTAGMSAEIGYENEEDNTRIIAGAAPHWNSQGFTFCRRMRCHVSAVGSGTITIDPPLLADGTSLAMRISKGPGAGTNATKGWGFEDFSVSFDPANHPANGFNLSAGENNWFYRVEFLNYSRNQFNGSCIIFFEQYRSEIRKCIFHCTDDASSDGAIQTTYDTLCHIENNVFSGPWGYNIYESGGSCSNVFSYNYHEQGTGVGMHNAHPSHNLTEGSWMVFNQEDGYHGSSSDNVYFGNNIQLPVFNRFKRRPVVANCILASRGSFGNPNIGNGSAEGFAGPTGTSDQVGQPDYLQLGYGVNEYIIQSGDVSSGDFWRDWKITATLTTRTSNTVGVFTVSGGQWYVGVSATGGATLLPHVWWDSRASGIGGDLGTLVTAVSGSLVTISFASGTLPTAGTSVEIFPWATGYQERDLDVQASATYAGNTINGVLADSISPNTFPNSLVHASKPAWWNEDGFTGAWPPDMSSAANFPAGARYLAGQAATSTITATTVTFGTLTVG